jgi:hypothetical protein
MGKVCDIGDVNIGERKLHVDIESIEGGRGRGIALKKYAAVVMRMGNEVETSTETISNHNSGYEKENSGESWTSQCSYCA